MSVKWGGKGEKGRDTVVLENGPYEATHHIGETQSMCFKETDEDGTYLFTYLPKLVNRAWHPYREPVVA